MSKLTKPSDAAVLAWIEAELHEDVREPGWMTVREIAYATGRNITEVVSRLEKGVNCGAVKKKNARVQTPRGKRIVAVYNVKPEPADGNPKKEAARGRRR